jgi:hypothetical protein
MLGEIGIQHNVFYNPEEKQLAVYFGSNPAIFVPDLNKVIFGYESWWGEIKSPEELREITDDDIQNVWYVKALKMLEAKEAEDAGDHGAGGSGEDAAEPVAKSGPSDSGGKEA